MYPQPSLDHLAALTDDVGPFQHATFDVPNRACGYCTDDVGRGLIVACDAAARPASAEPAARLIRTYLAYLQDAQLGDGWFHGFMGYDRRWQDASGTPDAVGRALWGLGYAEAHAPRQSWRELAGRLRARAMPAVGRLGYMRSRAYAILGLGHALATAPADAFAVREGIAKSAELIFQAYQAERGPGWDWCEDQLTYDNARLPEALLRAGAALGHEPYVEAGLAMLRFYETVTVEDGLFVPIGNAGWFPRGGSKSRSGQQPLEAAALVDAALVAQQLTGDPRWRGLAETAHGWFLGRNSQGAVLARGGGCCDGLDETGPNPNMGAESSLAYLASAGALARALPLQPLRLAR